MVEIPSLRKLHDAHRDKGVEIVRVSLDDDADAVQAFVAESRVTWPSLFGGATAPLSYPLAVRCGITRIPQQIVVGRDGTVVSIHHDMQSLAKTVEALLRL